MFFTSLIFFYLFLPLILIIYWLINPKFRNALLLVASLIFYAWAGVSFTLVLIGSIGLNYASGLLIGKTRNKTLRSVWYVLGILLNLTGLAFFKYTSFLIGNINVLISLFKTNPLHVNEIFLPLGISFFTFRGICYLITVKRGETPPNKNIIDLGLYIGFFATLIAGPIDRYRHIEPQLKTRKPGIDLFASGVRRFALGLVKKVVISVSLGNVADYIFTTPPQGLNVSLAWLGAFSYMLQVYYDFSGYTDMAVGLGRMFGFQITENFNFPYLSRSIRDFWKRWHITLSTFLRDYLFLPTAYSFSRKLKKEKYLGIRVDHIIYSFSALITFFICGLWHGANWTFIVWGLLFGILLVLERTPLGKFLDKGPSGFARLYTLFFILVAWVIFRSPDLSYAGDYLKVMAGFGGAPVEWIRIRGFADREFILMAFLAVLGCTTLFSRLLKKIRRIIEDGTVFARNIGFHLFHIGSLILILLVLAWSTMSILTGTLQGFIYFKF